MSVMSGVLLQSRKINIILLRISLPKQQSKYKELVARQ